MPVRIEGKIYNLPGDSGERGITMGEQHLLERQFKKPIEKLFTVFNISDKARKSLPEAKLDELEVASREVFLAMVWIARRRAGENLTFEEAIDVEVEAMDVVENDADPLETVAEVSKKKS
jgi:hypothetical protein